MAKPAEIRAQRKQIEKELRDHMAAEKLIRVKLDVLQAGCLHPRMKSYSDGDPYSPSSWRQCPDCGKRIDR